MSIATRASSANETPATRSQPLADQFLVATGLVGPVFFCVVVLVDGATRPGYTALHHPVSTLALGPGGWLLTAALGVLGALLLCFAVGLRRVLYPGAGSTWAPILIALSGVSFIGQAIFASDPMLGFPPAAPDASTLHGTLHNVLTVVLETPPIVAACIVIARRFAQAPSGDLPWVIYSIATITLALVLQALGVLVFLSNDPGSPFGLFQRLQFFALQGWIAVLAGRLLSWTRPDSHGVSIGIGHQFQAVTTAPPCVAHSGASSKSTTRW